MLDIIINIKKEEIIEYELCQDIPFHRQLLILLTFQLPIFGKVRQFSLTPLKNRKQVPSNSIL